MKSVFLSISSLVSCITKKQWKLGSQMNLGKKEYIAIYHIKEILVFTNDMKQKNKQKLDLTSFFSFFLF